MHCTNSKANYEKNGVCCLLIPHENESMGESFIISQNDFILLYYFTKFKNINKKVSSKDIKLST